MSNLLKNLITALLIALSLGGVYFLISSNNSEYDEFASENSDIELQTQKILSDTNKINELKIDTTIFDDQSFMSLRDYGISITDVQPGRSNPFAPLN